MKDLKDISKRMKEKIDASGIKEKMKDVTGKVKADSVVDAIKKGVSKVSSLRGDKSILAFSKTCTRKYIELGETVEVTIKLQSRYETGVLDCIVTDEIPPQFMLIGEMPAMICQLNPHEEVEYQYKIKANVGGHFSTRALCEIENKFSLDDFPSNDIEIYVSPLSIQMNAVEMAQKKWKEVGFIFKNISKETMMSITVSLKQDSKFSLEKEQIYNNPVAQNQSVVIPLVLKTEESGSVNLNLDVVCVDEKGVEYRAEKDFLVEVIETDKTTTKVDMNIGSIGEVVASGATQIRDSVIQRSTVGAAETGGTSNSLTNGRGIEVSEGIVQRSEIGGGADVTSVERRCANAKCDKVLQEEWKRCPFCGLELELKCYNCNQKVEAGWLMCPYCGEKLK